MWVGFGSISGRLVEQQRYQAKWEAGELSRVLSAFREGERGVCAHLCSFRMYPYIAERWDVLENILRVLNAVGEGGLCSHVQL